LFGHSASGRSVSSAAAHPAGQLLQRALIVQASIRMGITVTLDQITAEEFDAVLVIEEAENQFDKEDLARR
jgi:hypothetical protein